MTPTDGPATPPLEAIGLRRAFGHDRAVDRLDLTVAAGEVHAVVGLNGAGKTTLMRLLLAMLRPDGGQARVLGVEASRAGADVWSRVGHMIELPALWPELTVRDHLEVAARLHRPGVDRPGRGVDWRGRRAVAQAVDEAVDEAVVGGIDRFGLGRWAGRRARELSLGNRQRVGLACALVHRPRVVVLDEPSNGLDPAGVVAVRDLLATAAAAGTAVMVSSHHLDEIARIADRITVLHRGRTVGVIDPGGIDLERRFFDLVHAADRGHREDARA